jgi:23S rRNA pseudouridine955/2504/2580 synthase
VVDENSSGQRIDNFLLRELKGVPKSHVYRLLRTGQVRVNSKRIDATYRLQSGDAVRIPPVSLAQKDEPAPKPPLAGAVKKTGGLYQYKLYEDDHLLAIDKPAGVAVHGGSGVSFGAIERLRQELPKQRFLELVHRLDRDTSGVLLLAKKRSALTALHAALRGGACEKHYLVLAKGLWQQQQGSEREVNLPLHKYVTGSGERRVSVADAGREAQTRFILLKQIGAYCLLRAELGTGRTHQIRVHLAHLGYPIAGDDKYGDFEANRVLARLGLKRMFLHAAEFSAEHPATAARLSIKALLPKELKHFLDTLDEVQPEAHSIHDK